MNTSDAPCAKIMISFLHTQPQVLNADEAIKRLLLLGGKSALHFALTSSEPGRHRYDGETGSDDVTASSSAADFTWVRGSTGNTISSYASAESHGGITGASSRGWGPSGPHGTGALQKVLDAMTTVGVAEGERYGLLRGLSAVLHLGQVSVLTKGTAIERE